LLLKSSAMAYLLLETAARPNLHAFSMRLTGYAATEATYVS
jgi:hypothetical protein